MIVEPQPHDLGTLDTHLRVAHATVFASPATSVVVDHDALAQKRLLVCERWPTRRDDATRLVAADHSPGRTLAIGMQIAAADPRGTDRDYHVGGVRLGIGEFFERHLAGI
jgi:hypothetical protein